ncbi:MAG: hypothetical protein ACRCXZ_04895 [Patescibacteria group bacterium]
MLDLLVLQPELLNQLPAPAPLVITINAVSEKFNPIEQFLVDHMLVAVEVSVYAEYNFAGKAFYWSMWFLSIASILLCIAAIAFCCYMPFM